MSGPILGDLSNNRWSGVPAYIFDKLSLCLFHQLKLIISIIGNKIEPFLEPCPSFTPVFSPCPWKEKNARHRSRRTSLSIAALVSVSTAFSPQKREFRRREKNRSIDLIWSRPSNVTQLTACRSSTRSSLFTFFLAVEIIRSRKRWGRTTPSDTGNSSGEVEEEQKKNRLNKKRKAAAAGRLSIQYALNNKKWADSNGGEKDPRTELAAGNKARRKPSWLVSSDDEWRTPV